jgi:hypothetical protein
MLCHKLARSRDEDGIGVRSASWCNEETDPGPKNHTVRALWHHSLCCERPSILWASPTSTNLT